MENWAFGIGGLAMIIGIKIEGRVTARMEKEGAVKLYLVVYWYEGERMEEWFSRWELA